MSRTTKLVALGGVPIAAALVVLAGASSAGADVVSPPGACIGSGTWQSNGQTETSTEHSPSDLIPIPQEDTVAWSGSVGGAAAEGPRREISGEISVELPMGSVVVDDWGGDSGRYANEGEHDYNLPSVLIGIELTLSGTHSESGSQVCSGSVGMVVEGDTFSNPLAAGSIAGLLVSGAGLAVAARGKP